MPAPTFSRTTVAAVLFSWLAPLSPQQPAAPPAPPQAVAPESSSKQGAQKQGRHADDFLVRGTVFTPDGLAFSGAELRIRRTSDKKFQWRDSTNSRGEFAIRVKMGSDYEVVASAKGFQEQALPVDAKTGERFKDLIFRMQRQEGKK